MESLRDGDDDHDLRDVRAQRVKLLRIAENIDAISGRIARLDAEPPGPGAGGGTRPAGPARLQLQRRIRQDAVNFVKATLVGLPDAPSEDEFGRLRARRVKEAEERVEEERRTARMAKERAERQAEQARRNKAFGGRRGATSPSNLGQFCHTVHFEHSHVINQPVQFFPPPPSPPPADRPKTSVSVGSGFVLTSSAGSFTSSDDPMVQQIRNLREYIREARRLGRRDEVAALEENLRELQSEFQRTQGERRELEDNFNDFKGMFHKHSPKKAEEGSGGQGDESVEAAQEYVDIDEYDASGKNPFFDE